MIHTYIQYLIHLLEARLTHVWSRFRRHLELLERSATSTPYVARLMQALPTSEKSVSTTDADTWLLEPLSERELEILRLLPTGRSSPDLASYLEISVNTIKTHMKNIYSKLGVHKRHEAMTKAQELGIV